MPRRIQIALPLGVDELEQRDRQAQDAVEIHHFPVIWLLARSKRTEEVA